MKTVVKIEPAIPQMPVRKKVAAYARVSMETERLNHSLSAQISHYSELIQKHSDWQYVGVYADDGISGTGTSKRKAQLAAAEEGWKALDNRKPEAQNVRKHRKHHHKHNGNESNGSNGENTSK